MKLDSYYTIEQDTYNVILRYYKEGEINPKTGKPTISSDEWYYKNLKDALMGYVFKSVDANQEAKDLLSALRGLEKRIMEKV